MAHVRLKRRRNKRRRRRCLNAYVRLVCCWDFPLLLPLRARGIAGASFENKVKRIYFGLDCLYLVSSFPPPQKNYIHWRIPVRFETCCCERVIPARWN